MTEKRYNKFSEVIKKRQKGFTIVMENIDDPHNVSAILRTAEVAGIDEVYLIYGEEDFPKIGKQSSSSAKKWVELKKFTSVKECFDELHKKEFKIYSTAIIENSENKYLYDLDLAGNVAIVLGNENRGVSEEVIKYSDKNFIIPMFGMIQSLNVSVTAGICIFEGVRQRLKKGLYENTGFTEQELKLKLNKYIEKGDKYGLPPIEILKQEKNNQ
ncbi:MAG TPA: RNA methyltransferase [Ignavibacteria bacterium]|nr:RNA methyltransferase [Ignavibacteria bacterium]